jgi:predicted alpha/beta superfamily hydrolase
MNKCFILFCFLLFSTGLLQAQYSLRLVVTDVATKKLDDIYVMGSFNEWKPGDFKYKLKPLGPTRRAIVLKDLPAGKYEFKFIRGGAPETIETTAKGEDISNRVAELNGDLSLDLTIPGWKDDYPDKPIPNTASPQVQLLDSAFAMPQFGRQRRIWIYLPKTYSALKGKSYPVLYMQDGQNLFNLQTAKGIEWSIDETLDSLQKAGGKECIVVGIDHGGAQRASEYDPYKEGRAYGDFLAKTLKPFIDSKYRTLKDAAHTWVAGSDLGGVISLYAVMKYPTVFGAVGVFSPSFDLTPNLATDVQAVNWATKPRFYFYAGAKETTTMVSDMDKMITAIEKKSKYDMNRSYFPLGQHNETYWRREFVDFYKWLNP